jgi:O-antigen biosynthesis protein
MKILLYLDPWIDVSDRPEFKLKWLEIFLESTIRSLYSNVAFVAEEKLEIKLICSDIANSSSFEEECGFIDFIEIDQKSLKSIFKSYDDYFAEQTSKTESQGITLLNKLIEERLKGFVPDVIIPISTFVNHLKYLFPKSLILFNESGIFARNPYPADCLYFDCCSTMSESFVVNHRKEILSYPTSKESEDFLYKLREFFGTPLISLNPFKDVIRSYRKRFDSLVLVSLQVFESPMFLTQGGGEFKDQIEYLEYILENIDSKIGVIVTEHVLDKILIYKPIVGYFSKKYDNFIYLSQTEIYPNSSQFLINSVDGVITLSSTVGLQALLYKKPLFVPSKTSYLAVFSDEQDLSKISDFLKVGSYRNKDGALYYLLTRYYVLGNYYKNGEWFYNFLKKSLNKFRDGVDFSFYDRIDSDENLLKIICDPRSLQSFEKQLSSDINKKKLRGIKKIKNSIKKRLKKIGL